MGLANQVEQVLDLGCDLDIKTKQKQNKKTLQN